MTSSEELHKRRSAAVARGVSSVVSSYVDSAGETRSPITSRGTPVTPAPVGVPQGVEVVDMVEERGESHLPIPTCRLPYPLELM